MKPININKIDLNHANENTEFFMKESMKQEKLFLAMCFTLGVLVAVCIVVTVFPIK